MRQLGLDAFPELYIVDHELVDELNAGASILNNDPTTIEELSSGGFEIKNVRSGSLADELGLQSGDIPLTINDYNVATMSEVFIALSELRHETSLTVVLKRGTNDITLHYSIE